MQLADRGCFVEPCECLVRLGAEKKASADENPLAPAGNRRCHHRKRQHAYAWLDTESLVPCLRGYWTSSLATLQLSSQRYLVYLPFPSLS
jgi:hypothetical protein